MKELLDLLFDRAGIAREEVERPIIVHAEPCGEDTFFSGVFLLKDGKYLAIKGMGKKPNGTSRLHWTLESHALIFSRNLEGIPGNYIFTKPT
jgi:hypothetical protein